MGVRLPYRPSLRTPLSLLADQAVERPPAREPLHTDAVRNEAAHVLPLLVILLRKFGETELRRLEHLHTPGEFGARTTERLRRNLGFILLGPDGDEHLPDVDARRGAVALAVSTAHPRLKPISPCTGQHLVNAQNVERVRPDAHMEEILASVGDHVLVRSNARRLKSLAVDLLALVGHEVNGGRELVTRDLLLAHLVDADLRVRHAA